MELPRSPRTTWPSQARYWTAMGRSSPYRARNSATAAGVASDPSITADGSPGASRMSTKAMMVTSHSTKPSEATRPASTRVMPSALVLDPHVPEARRGVEDGEAFGALTESVEAEEIAVLDHGNVLVELVLDLLIDLRPRLAVALEEALLEERVDLLARVGLVAGVGLEHEGEAARVGADGERVVGNVPLRPLFAEDIDHGWVVVRLELGGEAELAQLGLGGQRRVVHELEITARDDADGRAVVAAFLDESLGLGGVVLVVAVGPHVGVPELLFEEEARVEAIEGLVPRRRQHDLFLVQAHLDGATELPLLELAVLRVEVHDDLVVGLEDEGLHALGRGEPLVGLGGEVLPVVVVAALHARHPTRHLGHGHEVDVLHAREAPSRVPRGIRRGRAVVGEALEVHVLVRHPLGEAIRPGADDRGLRQLSRRHIVDELLRHDGHRGARIGE